MAGLTLKVANAANGGILDKEYTCDGKYVSPPVEWSGVPEGAKSLALIMWHTPPDYKEKGAKYYWIVYNIPPTVKSLPTDVGATVGKIGMNEHNFQGYEPPCSKSGGDKIYHFTIYALMEEPTIKVADNEVTRDVLLSAMKDITIACNTVSLHNVRTAEDLARAEERRKAEGRPADPPGGHGPPPGGPRGPRPGGPPGPPPGAPPRH